MYPADLIQRYLEDNLSTEEAGQLKQWLEANPENFKTFAAETFLHEQLREVLGEHTVREVMLSQSRAARSKGQGAESMEQGAGSRDSRPVPARASRLPAAASAALAWAGMALSVAAVAMVFAGIARIVNVAVNRPQPAVENAVAESDGSDDSDDIDVESHSVAAVAQIARTSNCVWDKECTALEVGDDLEAGRTLKLESGLAEIIFQGGAHTLLQGPATLEVVSPSVAFLHSGKFTVTVENAAARGFVVHTPGMKYTDLGTEFGVLVGPRGQEEVHVFRGKVVADKAAKSKEQGAGSKEQGAGSKEPMHAPGPVPPALPASLVLTSEQAIRVASAAKPIERMHANEQEFVRTGQMTEAIVDQSPALRQWMAFRASLCRRDDLVAYYDCQYDVSDRGVVHNLAATGDQYDGRMLGGVRWSSGRLPGKQALRFRDRDGGVRIELPEEYQQISLIASIKVDKLSGSGYQMVLGSNSWRQRPHALHWQLSKGHGSGFGVSGPPATCSVYGPKGDTSFVGHWVTMAITCDAATHEERTYLNGVLQTSATNPVVPVQIGEAMIGTFHHEDADIDHPERTLRGQIDELMIFKTALSPEEIARISKEMNADN